MALIALSALCASSFADLVEPTLPAKHQVKTMEKEELPSFDILTNPDLPNRRAIKVAKVKVHSAARVVEQYDSNVFLADTDLQYDFITILSPSVGVEVKMGDSKAAADYEISQYLFGIWHDQNHLDHRVRIYEETPFHENYKIIIKDEFRIFTDRASNENSLRLKENTNDLKAGISAKFNKFGFDTGYINKIRTYDSHDLMLGGLSYSDRSYMDQSVYGTLNYLIHPKTYLILQNDLGYIKYFETSQIPGSYYMNATCGVRGEWTNKVVVNIRGGMRYQHYNTSYVIADKPFIGPIVKGGLEYTPSKNSKLILSLERANYESTYATNNYYTVNVVGIEYRRKLYNKVSGTAFGSYQLHAYPTETTENGVTAKRYDNFFNTGLSVRYDIQEWASVEARYERTQKVSIFDIFDYIDNIVSLRGTVGF